MTISCAICTEGLANENVDVPVSVKTCGHCFHQNCLKTWLKKSSTCPVCRIIVLDSVAYVGRLHFQRTSLDCSTGSTSVVESLIDQNMNLEKSVKQMMKQEEEFKIKEEEFKKKELEFKRNEDAWKIKEKYYKDKQKEAQVFFNSISNDLKGLEAIRSKISNYTQQIMRSGSSGSVLEDVGTRVNVPSLSTSLNSSSTRTATASTSSRTLRHATSTATTTGSIRTITIKPISRASTTRGRLTSQPSSTSSRRT